MLALTGAGPVDYLITIIQSYVFYNQNKILVVILINNHAIIRKIFQSLTWHDPGIIPGI